MCPSGQRQLAEPMQPKSVIPPLKSPNGLFGETLYGYGFVMPKALLVLGIIGTFAWVMFLGWCVVTLVL